MIRLCELRKQNKISQEELAEKFKVERTAISRWENGKNHPSLDVIIELSKMFSVSIDYLLGFDDDTSTNAERLMQQIKLHYGESTVKILKSLEGMNEIDKNKVLGYISRLLEENR